MTTPASRTGRVAPAPGRHGNPVGYGLEAPALTDAATAQDLGDRPPRAPGEASVDLYWLPLGAGDGNQCVRGSGRVYEALMAAWQHRGRSDLYHSALIVRLDGDTYAIEMAQVWAVRDPDRGVVTEGPVGFSSWGRSRFFRYEVRCWRGGRIPDLDAAVDSPRRVSADERTAHRVLELLPSFPVFTWGRDEQRTGEMWNSNSLTAWLLARSGHDTDILRPPARGRAPGWTAGLVVAAREEVAQHVTRRPYGGSTAT
jgi:hypothetical protein